MVRYRRSLQDYDEALNRFEDFLDVREGKLLTDIESVNELEHDLKNWFTEIEVDEVHQSSFAQSMIAWVTEGNKLGKPMRTRVKVIRVKRRITFFRNRSKWTNRELGLLSFRYQRPQKFSVETIARNFGRSKKAIYNKARRLKLKRKLFEIDEGDI